MFLLGFFVLGLLAYRTYQSRPPDPRGVVEPGGQTLFTRDDIMDGQKTFLREGLMEYGSIFGHGAYLGPDYTADYLRRAALSVRDRYGGAGSDRALQRTITDFRRNRYDCEHRHPHLHRTAGGGVTESSSPTIARTSATRRPSSDCAPMRSTTPSADPQADRLLQLGGLGDLGRAPGPQLLLHEQLAPEPLVANRPRANGSSRARSR